MITLLPLNRVIVAVAVFYGGLIAVIVGLVAQNSAPGNLYAKIKISLAGSTALSLSLLFIIHIGWKWLWARFPVLNTLLFPNLEGVWNMTIHYEWNGRPGEVTARALIKQDFVKISMEVESPGSNSRTLIAQPKKDPESGRPLLYYVYQVDPIRVGAQAGTPYIGSAILRYSGEAGETLSGNYFTSQSTHGHFVLTRI